MNHKLLNQDQKHKKVLREFTFNDHRAVIYTGKKIDRSKSLSKYQGILIPVPSNETVSSEGRTIYPEFLEYCYSLEGCPKKLLLYLMFHQVDLKSCEFTFNDQTIHAFKSYHTIVCNHRKPYTTNAIKSALRMLVKVNVSTCVKRGKYMLNPMIMGGMSSSHRRSLIIAYSFKLLMKDKDVSTHFYPV